MDPSLLQNNSLSPRCCCCYCCCNHNLERERKKSKHVQFFILSVSAWRCFPQSSFTVWQRDAVSAGTLPRERWVPGAARPLMLLPPHCPYFLGALPQHTATARRNSGGEGGWLWLSTDGEFHGSKSHLDFFFFFFWKRRVCLGIKDVVSRGRLCRCKTRNCRFSFFFLFGLVGRCRGTNVGLVFQPGTVCKHGVRAPSTYRQSYCRPNCSPPEGYACGVRPRSHSPKLKQKP